MISSSSPVRQVMSTAARNPGELDSLGGPTGTGYRNPADMLRFFRPASSGSGCLSPFFRPPYRIPSLLSSLLLAVLAAALVFTPIPLTAAEVGVLAPRVQVDRTFNIGLTVRDAPDLHGVALDLTYDPRIISVVDRDGSFGNGIQPLVSEGPFLSAGGTTATLLATALEDGLAGRLVLGVVRKGPSVGISAPTTPPRLLANVAFRARSAGTTELVLERVVLHDSSGGVIPAATRSVISLSVSTSVPNSAPVARAGPDRTRRPGTVLLDASLSTDPEGDALTYSWARVAGPSTGTLARSTRPVAVFDGTDDGDYTFEVTVSDGALSATDQVVVTLETAANTRPTVAVRTPGGGGSGAVLDGASEGPLSGAIPIGFVLFDAEGDPVSIQAEYSIDGGATFQSARAAGGDGTQDLSAPPSGAVHLFLWNSVVDLGQNRRDGVLFKIIPSDGGGAGAAGQSAPFDVENASVAALVFIRAPTSGQRFFEGERIEFSGAATSGDGTELTGSSLSWSSDLQGAFASGATPVSTLTTGVHEIRLTATDSQSRSASVTLAIEVVPRPESSNTLTITGRITSTSTGEVVPDGTRITFFNLLRRVSSGARVLTGDGIYSTVLSRTDSIAAAPGDPLLVAVHSPEGVLLTAQPRSLVLTLSDFVERIRTEDITVGGMTTLSLHQGLNLVALPSDPGTTSTTFTASQFIQRTGASFVARAVPVGPVPRGRIQVYLPGGEAPDFPMAGDRGYFVRLASDFDFVYQGRPWPAQQRSRDLHQGINLIAFARGVPSGFSVADLGTLAQSRIVALFGRRPEESGSVPRRFRLYSASLGLENEPVQNGKAYLVVAPRPRTLTLPEP